MFARTGDFPAARRDRGNCGRHLYDGFFIDIGVPADLERAQSELPEKLRRPAVFFDRDGVLNVDKGYVHKVEDFEWIAGAREAIKLCNDRGYLTFVVTNQAGVARGYYGIEAIEQLHGWINRDLARDRRAYRRIPILPVSRGGHRRAMAAASDRRKPAPGMILDCLDGWPVRKETSLLVGDKPHDMRPPLPPGYADIFCRRQSEAFIRPLLGSSG